MSDDDFYIYNDVVVRHPDGRLDILGYPHEVFLPTDFHTATLGAAPDLDRVDSLFRPPVPHTLSEEHDEYDTTRITVDGVLVRYVHSSDSVQMTVEGDLPEETVPALTAALRDTLSALEHTACAAKPL